MIYKGYIYYQIMHIMGGGNNQGFQKGGRKIREKKMKGKKRGERGKRRRKREKEGKRGK